MELPYERLGAIEEDDIEDPMERLGGLAPRVPLTEAV